MNETIATQLLALVEAAEPHLQRSEQQEWLAQLDEVQEEIRAALHWAVNQPDKTVALRMAGGLWRYWYTRSMLMEGQSWLEQALAGSSDAPIAARAVALDGAGVMAMEQGQFAAARTYHEDALRLYEALSDLPLISGNLESLGVIALYEADYDQADAYLQRCLAIRQELGDPDRIASTFMNLAAIAFSRGDHPAAWSYTAQASALRSQLTSEQLNIGILSSQAMQALMAQDFGQASTHGTGVLERGLALGSPHYILMGLETLAAVAVESGDPARAARIYGAADALYESTNIPITNLTTADRPERLNRARQQLGADDWQSHWEAGRQLQPAALLGEDAP